MVKKTHLIKHGRRIQCKTENYLPVVVPGLATGSSSSSTSTSPTSSPQDSVKSTSRPASKRSESVSELVLGDPLHDLPERLQEFTENLTDERVPIHRNSPASSSRESASEPQRKVVPGKHSIYTHFPKGPKLWSMLADQNDKGALHKTHWRSIYSTTTTNHKFPNDEYESRKNHRYAVVVQDLTTQWSQSCPCKTKTSQ